MSEGIWLERLCRPLVSPPCGSSEVSLVSSRGTRRRGGQDLAVQRTSLLRLLLQGNGPLNPRASRLTHRSGQDWRFQKPNHGLGEATRFARRGEETGLTLTDDLWWNSSDCRGDHRLACGHGFQDRDGQAFGP